MANLNLSQFGEKLFVADADHTFIWDTAASISKRVSRNSWLNSGTLTSDAPVTISQTWNAGSNVMTALRLNVTDTVSAGTSSLFDARTTAGGSQFSVQKGVVVGDNYSSSTTYGVKTPFVSFGSHYGSGALCGSVNGLTLFATPTVNAYISIGAAIATIGNTNSALAIGAAADTILLRDGAANTLALRNGAAAQTFNVYGTYTSASVYERMFMRYNGTDLAFQVGAETLGATARPLQLWTGGASRLHVTTAGNVGIGTTAPTSGLHISGPLGTDGGTYNSSAAIKLTNTTSNNSWLITSGLVGVANAHFSIRRESIALPALTIAGITDNVGIGTTSPTSKLHVAGNSSPSITVDNTIATGASQLLFKNTVVTGDTDGIFLNGSAQSGFGGAGSINIKATTGPIAFHTASVTNALSIAQNGITTLASGLAVGATHASSLADFIASGSLVLGSSVPQVILNSTTSAQESRFASGGNGFFFDVAGHATASNNDAIFRTGQTNASYNLTEVFRITYNGLITFGGLANTVPAIKRSTVRLQARLADDSAFTNIQGKLTTDTDYTAGSIVPTGFLTLYDAQGNAYKVPCVAA